MLRTSSKNLIRATALLLAGAQALLPFAAHAVSTDLSDVPLAVLSGAKPNILFMLDNSGSMAWGTITGADATAEYNAAKTQRAYYSPTYNRLYYNPAITYLPPVQYDSTAFTTNFTSSMGNAPTDKARIDPYPTTGGDTDIVAVNESCWTTGADPTLPTFKVATDSSNFDAVTSSCKTPKPIVGGTKEFARYAFYYNWKGSGIENGSGGVGKGQDVPSNYARIDIIPSVATFNKPTGATRDDCGSGSSCTYAQEIQNFANWFSYYRTRILTAKTSLGLAFSVLDSKSRAGLATINDNKGNSNTSAANFVALADFDSSQKKAWYEALYALNPGGGTPLIAALERAGLYFKDGKMQGSIAGDPIPLDSKKRQMMCTPNYTILSTDGYWNGAVASTNDDAKVPTLPSPVYTDPNTGKPVNDPIAGVPLVTGQAFPAPFYEGSGASFTGSLADVAMKYWITDLRPSSAGKVPSNTSDPATWQHMVTFTIGLGASGTVTSAPTGTNGWPTPKADTATAIDDLWHAGLSGHGKYFNTKDPAVLQDALAGILNDIAGRSGAAAAVAVSNPNVQAGDNIAFLSSYNAASWAGNLEAHAIDVNTGSISTTALWSAQTELDKLAFGKRYIASYSGSAGVAFATGKGGLTSSQLARLNSPNSPPGPSDNAAVIDFLRGDRTKEGTGGNASLPYRKRNSALGDIVDAEAIYVTPPRGRFTDKGYAAFKSSAASGRRKVVYQGANDGMLHAFDAGDAKTTGTGQELWAYVPGLLIDANLSAINTSTSSLVGLTRQTLFKHRNYVNGTPIAGDVDLSNVWANQAKVPAANWATVLIGGLGKGGRGYYALNVTDPSAGSDKDVGDKVMWEFPNNATLIKDRPNIGQSYGTPVLIKTKATGWVVLVTSGYNNGSDTGGDGLGHLFVLDVATGALIKDIKTSAGSSASPSGLARISAFVDNPGVDDTTDSVYGGDLFGTVWRFDLSDASPSNWNAQPLATLVDVASGAAQPVTTAPELGRVLGKDGVTRRVVYVGTGQYLGPTDIPGASGANANATQRQSFYGLLDDLSPTPTIKPLRANLVAQQALKDGKGNINLTTNPVDLKTKKGWVLDFEASDGERVITNPVLSSAVVAFTSNTPSDDPCLPGGQSNIYFADYATGGAVANLSSRFVGNVMSSRPQIIVLPPGATGSPGSGKTGGSTVALIHTNDGGTQDFLEKPPTPFSAARIMWREVMKQ